MCIYTYIYIDMYIHISLFARADLSDEVLRRGKNVARARRALGDDRPPSVLNNGHYVPGYNSLKVSARQPASAVRNRFHDKGETEAKDSIFDRASVREPAV